MERISRVSQHLTSTAVASSSTELTTEIVGDVTVTITVPAADGLVDGRLILLVSRHEEPMQHVGFMDALQGTMMAGVDVESLATGETITVTGGDVGFPLPTLGELPKGTYYVQAVLNRYETFKLSTGHTVKLPPGDQGDGQSWRKAPGNLFCKPLQVHIGRGASLSLTLDQVMPPIDPPEDTKYVKHVTIISKRLSEFWGREVKLGAHVLLPEGFDEHPDARYPLALFHGHFPADFSGFRPEPPDPNLEPDFEPRFNLSGYNKIQQQEHHDFYRRWTSEAGFPRFLCIEIQHPTPYYDDSYAVNSASMGPWGDAIMYELLPYIESTFRGIGEGWARFCYGGSTGGWESLAVQLKYPDEFNGCFAACPDPVDFRAYTTMNIYEDKNAYYYEGAFKHDLLRPINRDYTGNIKSTIKDANQYERVLGSHGRGSDQWDIWAAVFGPQDPDTGYPKPLYDKISGAIDPIVAEYWKENFDLSYIIARDWHAAGLGKKVAGKLHIYCGTMDNYYLNNAVYLLEERLQEVAEPGDYTVDYGERAEHCWNGDHNVSNAVSRLRYNTMYLPRMMERLTEHSPEGADLASWRY